MSRSFYIAGECMVSVRGGAQMSGQAIGDATELGLTSDQISVTPTFYHGDVKVDDFGPNTPANVQGLLAEVSLSMTLVHYDDSVLDICLDESLGGGGGFNTFGADGLRAGARLAPAGRLLSRYRNAYWSGWHYVAVTIQTPVAGDVFRFRQCYLAQQPVVIPLGTEASLVRCNWRCIPYQDLWLSGGTAGQSGAITVDGNVFSPRRQVQSSGAVIWDHLTDDLPL